MGKLNQITTISSLELGWRYALLGVMVIGSLACMLSMQPFGQNPNYHHFADRRTLLGIPNFFDVMSNIPFLLVGLMGARFSMAARTMIFRTAWFTFFVGVAIVSVSSAYYHLNPNNETLVWDRLPMTIGFMGLFVALLVEYVSILFKWLLIPALLSGFSSVLYWYWYDDLRFYYWIQLIPLLMVPVVMLLFRSKYTH